MRIDPEATLRCWPIDVDVAGDTYTIPALPASSWLLNVAAGSYLDVVPGMLTDPTVLDDRLLLDGDLGDECTAVARAAITAASGTAWWTAIRLTRAVTDTWIGSELTLRGVDPTSVSYATYLAAAYRVATRYADAQTRFQVDVELDKPPAGVAPEDWFDEDAAGDLFEAAMSAGG